jgi:autotransporter-associated beta strand protein
VSVGKFLVPALDGSLILQHASNGLDVQPAGGYLQVLGRIAGPGGLTKLGPGTLQFWGSPSNAYAGQTFVSGGVLESARTSGLAIPGDALIGDDASGGMTATLRSRRDGQFNGRADFTVRRSGLLELQPLPAAAPPNEWLRTLTGAGSVNLAALAFLNISNEVSFKFDGAISGAGGICKFGLGTMVMLGHSPFTGPTTIVQGDYKMHGSASNSPVSVQTSGNLLGDGHAGVTTVQSTRLVAPESNTPGVNGATLDLQQVLFNGGVLNLLFFGPHASGGNDGLRVHGPVTGNASLSAGFRYAPREGDVLTLVEKLPAGATTLTLGNLGEGQTTTLNNEQHPLPHQLHRRRRQ